jgi:tetratricopeptide (TPR) repeat protein
MRRLLPFAGLLAAAGLTGLAASRLESRPGWILASTFLGAFGATTFVLHYLLAPRVLAKAEAAWAAGEPASTVLDLTAYHRAALGEAGHRIRLLRGRAYMALGFRNQAWAEYERADLRRVPVLLRPVAAWAFAHVPAEPTLGRIRFLRGLVRLAPRSAHLRHLMGILLLRRPDQAAHREAWEQLEATLPLAAEDIPILEDLLAAAVDRDDETVAERALAQLMGRHGDGRLLWDRGAGARFHLQHGRFRDALALAALTPVAARQNAWVWIAEAAGLRFLGDAEAALEICEVGLRMFETDFRLWMERFQCCLDLRRTDEAGRSLAEARRHLPDDAPNLRWEWQRREAEFAYWVDDDPERALRALASVPAEHQGDAMPPLRLRLLAATGQHEQAMAALKWLLAEFPTDLDLRLLEADCLAGMEAWDALMTALDALPAAAHERPDFWHLRGLGHAHRGDLLPARMDLERAARMAPDHIRLVLDAGHACAELGEWERSEEHWRQALRLDGTCEEALVQLADSRRALHDAEGARRMLRECLLVHPDSLDAQERLAELEAN